MILQNLILLSPKTEITISTEAWVAGVGTTISQVSDRERCILASGTNPRMRKRITGLQFGAQYRVRGNIYMGTLGVPSIFMRAHLDSTLPSGGQLNDNFTFDTPFDVNFIANATTMYFGIVPVTSVIGEYGEISFDIVVTRN